jgi:phage-related baseplate assembly protein
MTRFTASSIALNTLDRAILFDPISFAGIRAARIADLKARLIAAKWPYNVDQIETDPGVYLSESGSYRETLTLQAVNDASASVLLAFAENLFLDRLGDDQLTARMPGEPDERYRGRIQLAPEAFTTAGSAGAYVYWALGADIRVADVGVEVLNMGQPTVTVAITILSTEADGTPSSDLLNVVYKQLYRKDVKPLTDTVSLLGAQPVSYSVNAVLNVMPGPDKAVIQSNAQAALNAAFLNNQPKPNYWRLSFGVPRNAIIAALTVPGVDSVTLLSPVADVSTQYFQFGSMISSNITVREIGWPFPPNIGSAPF